MAADTLKIGGAQVNRKAVLIAGAVGVGVVGYAYLTRRPSLPEEAVTEEELDAVGDERIPTTGVPYDPNTPAPAGGISTNAEWSQFVTDRLQALGYDPLAVGDALGLFFDHKPMPPTQANLVRAAISQGGQPPVGGPWNVIEQQAPASVGMPAPILTSSMPAWRNGAWEYTIAWAPVPGATRYWFQHVGGSSGYITGTQTATIRAAAGRPDTWRVAGVNAAGVKGPEAELVKNLPAAPAGTVTTKPTAPTRVTAAAAGSGRARISWSGATGGPGSYYEVRSRGIVGTWTRVNATSYTTVARWRAGTRLAFEVRTRNAKGISPGRISNTIVIK